MKVNTECKHWFFVLLTRKLQWASLNVLTGGDVGKLCGFCHIHNTFVVTSKSIFSSLRLECAQQNRLSICDHHKYSFPWIHKHVHTPVAQLGCFLTEWTSLIDFFPPKLKQFCCHVSSQGCSQCSSFLPCGCFENFSNMCLKGTCVNPYSYFHNYFPILRCICQNQWLITTTAHMPVIFIVPFINRGAMFIFLTAQLYLHPHSKGTGNVCVCVMLNKPKAFRRPDVKLSTWLIFEASTHGKLSIKLSVTHTVRILLDNTWNKMNGNPLFPLSWFTAYDTKSMGPHILLCDLN